MSGLTSGIAALLFLLSVKTVEAFEIKDIAPDHKIAAQIGDKLVLSCRTTGCKSPDFSWRTQMDNPLHGTMSNQGSDSFLTLASVGFEHEHNYLCNAICGNERRERRVQIEVYSFPSDPIIEISKPLVLGKPSDVICRVPKVYPSERLVVSLKKDSKVLKVEEFFNEEPTRSVETKTVKMTFIPTEKDIRKEITCIAELPIEEMEFQPKKRQARHLLDVNFGPRNIHITASPDSTLMEGNALMLSCVTESHPPAKVVWKKQLANETFQHIAEGYNLSIPNAQFLDSGIYICEATNDVTNEVEKKTVSISIQAFSPTTPALTDGLETITEVEDFTVKYTAYNTPQQATDHLENKTSSTTPALTDAPETITEVEDFTIKSTSYNTPQPATDHQGEKNSPAPKHTVFSSATPKNHTITYLVDDFSGVSNDMEEIEIVIAKMEEPDYVIPVIIVVSSLATAAGPMAAILIFLFRKAKINGSYSLVNSQKPTV